MSRGIFAVVISFFIGLEAYADVQRCREISYKDFSRLSDDWKDKDLVAFASWCSSCKAKVIEAGKTSEQYIMVVAFDEKEAAEKVLKKFGVTSLCYYGDDLVDGFGITSLPWTKKL